jgi:dolichol-phosphate mannosyltransferase
MGLSAPAVLMIPADDDYNAAAFQAMYDEFRRGSDIVCASRFIPGGGMENCPFIKSALVRSAAFTLRHLAFLPTHDPTNGLRLFSQRVLSTIAIESTEGFTYSIELLVKAHRLGWKISEIPVRWFERKKGQSRFRVFRWMIPYLRWYFYAFETTYLRRKPETVPLKVQSLGG